MALTQAEAAFCTLVLDRHNFVLHADETVVRVLEIELADLLHGRVDGLFGASTEVRVITLPTGNRLPVRVVNHSQFEGRHLVVLTRAPDHAHEFIGPSFDAQLAVVGPLCRVVTQLLELEGVDKALAEVCALLGKALELSRVGVYRVERQVADERPRFEAELVGGWASENGEENRRLGFRALLAHPFVARKLERLSAKEGVTIQRFDGDGEREALDLIGAVSGFAAPVFVAGRPWGVLVGTTDHRLCVFQPADTSGFLAIADVIGKAIERGQAWARQQQQLSWLRRALDQVSCGALIAAEGGRLVYANRCAAGLLGAVDSNDLVGSDLHDVMPHAETLLKPRLPGAQQEIKVDFGFAGVRTVSVLTSVLNEHHQLVVFREVGHILRTEERRRRAEELAEVGEMAARLSHDLKNPLSSILAGLQVLDREVLFLADHQGILKWVMDEVRGLNGMVQDLLGSARPHPMATAQHELGFALTAIIDGFRSLAEEGKVTLALEVESPKATVYIDRGAFGRAVANLVLNAIEATGKGGDVLIGARTLSPEEISKKFPGFPAQGIIEISVQDDGPGISLERLETVFRPFYTTKAGGTGLGLAVAQEIVDAHGGVLTVQSSDSGSRFSVYMAASDRLTCFDFRPGCKGNCDHCSIRDQGAVHACWAVAGRAHRAETGRWLPECERCSYFLNHNLQPWAHTELIRPIRD